MRRLGQHFLINKAAIKKIIAALNLEKGEMIIEIGPGKGALTLPLAKKCQESSVMCHVIAIEKDRELAQKLEIRNEKLEITVGDALKKLPELISHFSSLISYKVVGNIPYYITGKLLRIIGELEPKPKLTVLTIQREVAERLTAKKGKMNLLAAAVQIWAEPKIIGYLNPSDFSPPPKVKSAIIMLNLRSSQDIRPCDVQKYYQLIRAIFKQPRKTLLNNLRTGLKINSEEAEKLLKNIGLDEKSRPQNLNIEMLISLLGLVSENIL